MTNLEAVSKIVNSIRALAVDGRISRRYVLSVLRGISSSLISQKNLERTLDQETNLYSLISCFELKKVNSVDCPIISFRLCKTLMKSKKPLPKLIFSRLGASIKEITSVDGDIRITVTSLEKYRRDKQRKFQTRDVVAYIDGEGYLYIPDHEIYAVNVLLITMETEKLNELCECEDKECKSGWEYNFIMPDKLSETIFKEALNTILGTYKQIQPDINPNSIENQ